MKFIQISHAQSKLKNVLAVAGCLLIAGCSTNSDGSSTLGLKGSSAWHKRAPIEEKIAYYAPTCEAYGFKKGTTAFSNCIAEEIREGTRSSRARADALSKSISDAFDTSSSNPPANSGSSYDKITDYSDVICTNGRVMTRYGCRYR